MLKKIITIMSLASLCLLAFFLNMTSPSTANPFEILLIFAFAYMSSLGVVTYFIYGLNYVLAFLSSTFVVSKKAYTKLSFKSSYYYATIIALAPILLMGMQSVGVVNIYGVLLVLFFIVIGCLYISKKIH